MSRRSKGSPLPPQTTVLQVQLVGQHGVAPDGTPNHQGAELSTARALKIQLPTAAAVASAPSGPAGGDLGGTYPNPTVVNVSDGALSANVVKSGDAAGGDLTGTYRDPTVAKLQGNTVNTNQGDGSFDSNLLMFNGDSGAWVGAQVTGDVAVSQNAGHAQATVVNVVDGALSANIPRLDAANVFSNASNSFGAASAGAAGSVLISSMAGYAGVDVYNASAVADVHLGGNTVNPARIEHGYGLGLNPPGVNGNYGGVALTAVSAQKVEIAYPYSKAQGGTDYADLDMRAMTTYKSIATAGWGVPAIYGSARVTAQNAAATLAAYTVGAADGSFLVSANINVTVATAHNFIVTCTYTDETNTSRTMIMPFNSLAGTFLTLITNTGGTVPYESTPLHIRCKAGTTITIATANGGGTNFTTVTYNGEGCIQQIK